jgi:putative transposase
MKGRFVTRGRDRKVAQKFLRKTMKRHGISHSFVTDKRRSYGAAMTVIGNADKRDIRRNNRAKNLPPPFLRRERAMQRFRSMRPLQKFVAVHASGDNHFNQKDISRADQISSLTASSLLARGVNSARKD